VFVIRTVQRCYRYSFGFVSLAQTKPLSPHMPHSELECTFLAKCNFSRKPFFGNAAHFHEIM
jgi:hypothetical protein